MKVSVEYAELEEAELHIRCSVNKASGRQEPEEEVMELLDYLENRRLRFTGTLDGETYPLQPQDIFYFEYVDGKVFAYTRHQVFRMALSLEYLEKALAQQTFFRCSRTMLVNLKYMERFKSVMGTRIIGTLDNGEEVVISRHYAKLLRAYLKEE